MELHYIMHSMKVVNANALGNFDGHARKAIWNFEYTIGDEHRYAMNEWATKEEYSKPNISMKYNLFGISPS